MAIINLNNYYKRVVDSTIELKLKAHGALLIEGPRWCGKTTTASYFANSIIKMDDPDNTERYLAIGSIQPSLLLQGETPHLIDEWQMLPSLWNSVRAEVDKRNLFGQFILTGSSFLKDLPKGTHSGIGRIGKVKMRPMSLYESKDSNGLISLQNLFDAQQPNTIGDELTLDDIAYLICRGGWPQSINQPTEVALIQARDYYDVLIDDDINRANLYDLTSEKLNSQRANRILRSYARNVAQSVSLSKIRSDIISNEETTFSENSLYKYISFFQQLFVLDDTAAWNPNLRSKAAIRSTDTRYFTDPSIACAALGIGPKDLLNDFETFGLFFENLCIRDLKVYAQELDGEIYHYRDNNGLECDAVMHLRNGKYGLIEIKLGSPKGIEDGIKSLTKLSNIIDTEKMNKPSFKMIITATGKFAYRNEQGIDIVPIGFLKP